MHKLLFTLIVYSSDIVLKRYITQAECSTEYKLDLFCQMKRGHSFFFFKKKSHPMFCLFATHSLEHYLFNLYSAFLLKGHLRQYYMRMKCCTHSRHNYAC